MGAEMELPDLAEEEEEEEEEAEETVAAAGEGRRRSVLTAIDFVLENDVGKWNTRPCIDIDNIVTHNLERSSLVRVFKKTNTRGGCFQLKKMNYISSATVIYDKKSTELRCDF